MDFVLVSDLHLDHWKRRAGVGSDVIFDALEPFQEKSETLVIAGDIGNDIVWNGNFLQTLKNKNYFKNIIFVTGNHDYYNSNPKKDGPVGVDVIDVKYYSKLSEALGIYFLNEHSTSYVEIDDVRFIGSTGWCNWNYKPEIYPRDKQMSTWDQHMNDSVIVWDNDKELYRQKRKAINEAAAAHAESIAMDLDMSDKEKNVIITHYIPLAEFCIDRPFDMIWNLLNGSFCSSYLEQIFNKQKNKINTWCFGHTHAPHDKTIGNTRFVCNPRGYVGEVNQWEPIIITV